MKLEIILDIPMPKQKSTSSEKPDTTLEQDVREALECIESGYDSTTEWKMINRLYKELKATPKKTKRIINILKMIEPVMAKYGLHGVAEEK